MDDEVRRSMARIGEATDRLLASAAALTDASAGEPSLLPGWTRGHVLTHVARNGDGLGNLLRWARTGTETPMYASRETRRADIEAGAGRSAADLAADVQATAIAFAAEAASLPGRGLGGPGPGAERPPDPRPPRAGLAAAGGGDPPCRPGRRLPAGDWPARVRPRLLASAATLTDAGAREPRAARLDPRACAHPHRPQRGRPGQPAALGAHRRQDPDVREPGGAPGRHRGGRRPLRGRPHRRRPGDRHRLRRRGGQPARRGLGGPGPDAGRPPDARPPRAGLAAAGGGDPPRRPGRRLPAGRLARGVRDGNLPEVAG